jgi:hypothetical protein
MDEPPRRPLTLLGLELSTIALLAVMLWPFGRNMIGLGWLAAVPLLALGVSRLRIRAARWLLTLLYLFCFGFLLLLFGGNPLSLGDVPTSTRIVVTLGLAQLILLWTPDTSGWLLAGRRRGWDGRLH